MASSSSEPRSAPEKALIPALIPAARELGVVKSKAYGVGRVVARERKSNNPLIFPPNKSKGGLTAAAESKFRFVPWLEEGCLQLLDLHISRDGETAWQSFRACQPAHIQNCDLATMLVSDLSLEQLEEVFADDGLLDATICIGEENRFQICDETKNTYGTVYHIREPRCKSLRMPFQQFGRHLRQWTAKSIMLKVKLREWGEDRTGSRKFSLQQSPGCPPALQQMVEEGIQWSWFEGLQARHRMGPVSEAALEIGGRDALLPAQYSISDRYFAQVQGSRKVLLIAPEHSFEGMYSFPVHHPLDGYSMVDWERPDETAWPLCKGVRGRTCLLSPGELLFVPSCWWLHQQLLGSENLTVTFTLGTGYRVRPPPAVSLRVSRVVEELLADVEGPAKILYWLQLLSREEEEDVIDVTTVRGYKQIEAVWNARDAVSDVSGWMAWKRLFPAMSDGRLQPTPWLNKDFKEPLYLTDKPRLVADNRTEEQRRFPELFKHVKA